MLRDQPLVDPNAVFDKKLLTHSLDSIGSYVYGYYRPNETEPFYVGKGQGTRVLIHWFNAIDGNKKHSQYEEIRRILTGGKIPAVKILAENLQNTKSEDIYGVVERVLQNTFGIERADDKVFGSRIKKRDPALVQYRNDGKLFPAMSLEAVYSRETYAKAFVSTPQIIATECNAPLLLVGLSGSYHPSYSQADLCEMARMYWVRWHKEVFRFERKFFRSTRQLGE